MYPTIGEDDLSSIVEEIRLIVQAAPCRAELAEEIGVPYQPLASFARTPTAVPRLGVLTKILKYYGYSIVKVEPQDDADVDQTAEAA